MKTRRQISALFDQAPPPCKFSPRLFYEHLSFRQRRLLVLDLILLASGLTLALLIVFPFLGGFSIVSHSQAPGLPVVWAAPSLALIDKIAAPVSMPPSVQIYAAKGEYESFQIGIRAPRGGVTNVNVTPARLAGARASIFVTAKTLYREHYVYVKKPVWGETNKSLGPGWYPDGLIPFAHPTTGEDLHGTLDAVPFSLAENQNASIWVDILVPRTAAAGTYTGNFTVTSDQGEVPVPVTLTVWNFALPVQSALLSSFQFWNEYSHRPHPYSLAANQELLRHRISPMNVRLADERSLIDDYGLNATHVGFWSGAGGGNCNMPSAPSVSDVQTAVSLHQHDLTLYAYTADEVAVGSCRNLYSTIKTWGRNLHIGGLNQLITMAPVAELLDDGTGNGRSAVDFWVVLPEMYDRNVKIINQAITKGDRVWSYNALEQDTYSPKWIISYAPINWRIQPGFINQSLGLSGLLYYQVDSWSDEPWDNVTVGYGPGEGTFVYPGDQVGLPETVVPSMRLKWLRDGVDDYDYIQLLKNAGQGAVALDISRQVGADWSHWARDAGLLLSRRIELGSRLASIMH